MALVAVAELNINLTFVSLTFLLPEKDLENEKGNFHANNTAQSKVSSQAAMETRQTSVKTADKETKPVKEALPEGFFDNKEADLRARGIKPVKPDIK